MKKLIVLVFAVFTVLFSNAQTDSTEVTVEVIDVVKLKDGRTLRGKIVVFEEKDGDIVFKTLDGKTYTFSQEEYEYFQEDVVYEKKKLSSSEIRERKDGDTEISLGLGYTFLNIDYSVFEDEFYSERSSSTGDIPISFRAGFGKYLTRQNYAGVTGEIALISDSKTYFNGGFRFAHQYDGYKSNLGLYIPIDIQFSAVSDDLDYEYKYLFEPQWGGEPYIQTDFEEIQTNFSSINFSVGQGFSFYLRDKKSISLEVQLYRNFLLSQSFEQRDLPVEAEPDVDFTMNGVRFFLVYNL